MLSSYLLTLIKKQKIREGSISFLTLCWRKCAKCLNFLSFVFFMSLLFPVLKHLVVLFYAHFHATHILVVSEASFGMRR